MAQLIRHSQTDVLTDVLGQLRLRGKVFCVSELSAPWSMSLPAGTFAHFHVIERGGAWLRLHGAQKAVSLASGDLVIIPHGKGHTLSDSPQTRPVPFKKLFGSGSTNCGLLRHGGGGAETLMTCGSFEFESAAENPLLALLPPLIHIRGHDGQMAVWLEPTLKLLAHEARQPTHGSEAVITRLTDIIFVQAVRAWLAEQPTQHAGWLGALRDPQIGLSLSLMHREPQTAWRVESLAQAVGMSRSPFAAKFTSLVGASPVTYLTRWRLLLAANLLARENLSVTEVASRVGYRADAAFSKAFKRGFGLAPGAYRRTRQGRDGEAA